MVKTSSIIFISISLLLSLVLPVVVAVVLHKKLRFVWKSVLVGALVFLVFQILTSIPLLGYLQYNLWYQAFSMSYPIIALLLVALSAGLFEEIGRYVGFRLLLRGHLNWEGGIAYGIGHGGLESLYIGTAFLNDLIYSFLINAGKVPFQISKSVISTLVDTVGYCSSIVCRWRYRKGTCLYHSDWTVTSRPLRNQVQEESLPSPRDRDSYPHRLWRSSAGRKHHCCRSLRSGMRCRKSHVDHQIKETLHRKGATGVGAELKPGPLIVVSIPLDVQIAVDDILD